MYCGRCGAQIPDDSEFCNYCGGSTKKSPGIHPDYVEPMRIGIYSIAAAFIQLLGYGSGFWRAWWQRCILCRAEETQAFRKNFYK